MERRAPDPLIPARRCAAVRLRTGAAAAFLNTATSSSALAIATLELQRTQHLSSGATGLRLMPLSVGVIAGRGPRRAGAEQAARTAVIGLGLALIGVADAGLIALVSSGWLVAAPVAVAGAGLGLSSVAANALGTDVGESLQAAAAGALNTAAQLGTALGIAALLLLSGATTRAALPLRGPTLGWAAAALLALTGAAVIAPCRRGVSDRRALSGGRGLSGRAGSAATRLRGRRARTAAARPGAPTPRA